MSSPKLLLANVVTPSIILCRGLSQLLVCLFLLTACPAFAFEQEFKSAQLPGVRIVLRYGAKLEPLPLNKLFSFTAEWRAPVKTDLSIKAFDARMPEHFHGMIVQPKITAIGPLQARVDGVKLHMQGQWTCMLTVIINKREETFNFATKLTE